MDHHSEREVVEEEKCGINADQGRDKDEDRATESNELDGGTHHSEDADQWKVR